MRTWSVSRPLMLCLFLLVPIVSHASTLASPEDDRRAKQALPPQGQALLYVYRTDGGARVAPAVQLNGRELGALAPHTYFMLPVAPGRLDLRAGDGEVFSIRAQSGRIYFVHLTVDNSGDGKLAQTSYGRGRRDVHGARLARAAQSVASSPHKSAREDIESTAAGRSGFNLIVKGGSFSLASGKQTVDTVDLDITTGSSAFGIEGEWITAGGWAFGAEYFGHSHSFTTPTGDGDMTVASVMVNVKKYFRYSDTIQPYLGVGLGGVAIEVSSADVSGGAGGGAAQAMAGLAFRWRYLGIYTEVKVHKAKAEDANGVGIDVGGTGLFAGLSVLF